MTTLDVSDTIVAIASPPGGASRGIIRLSGADALACLNRAFSSTASESLFASGFPTRRCVRHCFLALDATTRLPGKLLVWPDQKSYTRQPSAEFHTIGSPPLLELATTKLCEAGARLAERGEFTLRAFLSGRIDLTQAEAVLAVIDADSQTQLQNALTQLSGGIAGPLAEIRSTLIGVLAELEAGLDFVEEDIEFISDDELIERLNEATTMLTELNQQIDQRQFNRQAFKVVLAGPPNAGKSTLFNALAKQESAIVANVEGTTRDFLSAELSWDGIPIELIDTAGLDEKPRSEIESKAQAKTGAQIYQADLLIFCAAADLDIPACLSDFREHIDHIPQNQRVLVRTKTDLEPDSHGSPALPKFEWMVDTSCVEEVGIHRLQKIILSAAKDSQNVTGSFVSATATRAKDSLREASEGMVVATQTAESKKGLELVAAEIRNVLDHLGAVIGTVYTDDILDEVFGRFCIGK